MGAGMSSPVSGSSVPTRMKSTKQAGVALRASATSCPTLEATMREIVLEVHALSSLLMSRSEKTRWHSCVHSCNRLGLGLGLGLGFGVGVVVLCSVACAAKSCCS